MTSIRPVNPWTPELIKKDKELKEKYGPSAHIIPCQTFCLPKMVANNYNQDIVQLNR